MHSSTHTLAPPTREASLVAWLRLIRSRRVGAATFFRLMAEHGSADAALEALPEVARAAGVSTYAPHSIAAAEAELARGRQAGARLIAYGSADYPASLAQITDPPPLIWALGRVDLLRQPMVALVGARNASSLGTRMAKRLAEGLGEAGIVTVSGLARGVDTAAHMASLATGTIAVQAGGIDVIYPTENTRLGEDIAASGLRLSEEPPGLHPQARHFPRRNRIISGLARAVVVVEAAARSGSLITAKNALDQGRDVLAVPGHPFDARAAGCNMLIRDGAMLVRGVDDILEMLEQEPQLPLPAVADPDVPVRRHTPNVVDIPTRAPTRPAADTPKLHAAILSRLGPSPVAEDQLIRDLDLPAHAIAPELLNLELDGQITRQAGGLLSLKP